MKTMKKFAALMMLLCALMICTIPALAANESGSDSNVTETVSVTAGSNPPARGHKSDQNHDDDGPCVYRDGHHLRPDRGDPHYLRPLMKNTPKKEGL